jgi:hypothetical protein
MRLTLRTLLAYMDGMLDDEDTEALTAKIEESKFAPELMDRIRNVLKQLRLGAPKLEAKGVNDPNLVADYLDGTLSEEKISSFERICLDSDLNLSETAACHQILTILLGEPAKFSPDLRERIYRIPDSADDDVAAPPVQGPPVESDESEPPLSKDDIDELVVPPQTAGKGPLLTVLAIAIVALILLVPWPFADGSLISMLMNSGEPDATGTPEPGTPEPGAPEPVAPEPVAPEPVAPEPGAPEPVAPEPVAPEPGAPEPGTPEPGTPDPSKPDPSKPDPRAPDPGTPDPGTPDPGTPEPGTPEPGTPDPGTPDPGTPEPSKPEPGTPPVKPGPVVVGDPMPPAPGTATATPMPRIEVGRFTSAQQLLFRLNTADDTWMRVARTSMLRVGDELASPASYRPSISMVNGVQLIFTGRSNATLLNREMADDTPTIQLQRGRVVLVTSGRAGAAVVLAIRAKLARITFGDAESTVAVDVRDYLVPGAALGTASEKVVEVYPLGGTITWSEPGTELIVRSGQVLAMTDSQPVRAFSLPTPPEWTDMKVASSVAARAAETLEPAVVVGRPASLSLQEKVSFRQQETVALATDVLCQIGSVEAAVAAFGNERQHAYWPLHIKALRDEIARSAETAALVREAVTVADADNADKIMALVVGYSAEQLAAGNAKELVDLLESDKMHMRVLAYENLKTITGRANFYQAQKGAERQKDKIRYWRELLASEQIVYPIPPTALPKRDPVAP